jgi:hypothetical protein
VSTVTSVDPCAAGGPRSGLPRRPSRWASVRSAEARPVRPTRRSTPRAHARVRVLPLSACCLSRPDRPGSFGESCDKVIASCSEFEPHCGLPRNCCQLSAVKAGSDSLTQCLRKGLHYLSDTFIFAGGNAFAYRAGFPQLIIARCWQRTSTLPPNRDPSDSATLPADTPRPCPTASRSGHA